MALDSDLLDLHLHAAEITERGIKELAERIQSERTMYRSALTKVLDEIEDNVPNTSKDKLFEAFQHIQTTINELDWRASLVVIRWRDLDG